MAKIKLNSLLADLRGKMGTTIFSSNRYGFTAYGYRRNNRTRTNLQQSARLNFSQIQNYWGTLSVSQKGDWSAFAAQADNERTDWFGDPYYPDARSQFISINTYRLLAGLSYTATPPALSNPAPLPTMSGLFSVSGVPATSYIDNDAAFDASISYVHVALSVWPSPNRLSPLLPAKGLGVYPVGSFGPIDVSTAAATLFPMSADVGRYYFAFLPLSSELRPGTLATFSEAINTGGTT